MAPARTAHPPALVKWCISALTSSKDLRDKKAGTDIAIDSKRPADDTTPVSAPEEAPPPKKQKAKSEAKRKAKGKGKTGKDTEANEAD